MKYSPIASLSLVLLALATSGCHHWSLMLVDGYNFDFQGMTATRMESGDLSPELQHVAIDHRFGNVIVTTASGEQPRWEWQLKTWAADQTDAEGYLALIELRSQSESGRDSFQLVLPEDAPLLRGVESILTLHLPPGASVDSTNRHGDSRFSNLSNYVELNNAHGNVSVDNISAKCIVENRHGKTNIDNVSDLRLKAHHGNSEINGVGDVATIEIHHGDLQGSDFAGSVELDLHHGDAKLSSIFGQTRIESHHADVDINGVTGDVQIDTHHGDVDVLLDSNASPRITMDAEHGKTRSDFPTNGSGIMIEAKTRHGDVNIRKR